MPAMAMAPERFALDQTTSGTYTYVGPAMGMLGVWVLRFSLAAPDARPVSLTLLDRVRA